MEEVEEGLHVLDDLVSLPGQELDVEGEVQDLEEINK